MNLTEIRDGKYHILALGTESGCQVADFIAKLEQDNPSESRKLQARLDYVAENGPPRNEQQCRALPEYNGFELKTKKVRVLCFWDEGRLIICSIAFLKDGQKTFKPFLEKLKKNQKEYFLEKEGGK